MIVNGDRHFAQPKAALLGTGEWYPSTSTAETSPSSRMWYGSCAVGNAEEDDRRDTACNDFRFDCRMVAVCWRVCKSANRPYLASFSAMSQDSLSARLSIVRVQVV